MKGPIRPATPEPPRRRARLLPAAQRHVFQAALLDWYRAHARPLRIRTTREPWPVLVAEVMAQQTQIARVDEAWAGFLERFPTPRALAEASPAEVLRAWAGLGYNRRAVHLQRAATIIVGEHAGAVPRGIELLEALPGVGPYTARAVAALAFGQPVAAVDTNVRRVVGRLAGRSLSVSQLQVEADRLVARHDPATWTHASMELGATLCRAVAPACEACPVSRWCASAGRVSASPARSPVSSHGGGPAPDVAPPRRPRSAGPRSSRPRAGCADASWRSCGRWRRAPGRDSRTPSAPTVRSRSRPPRRRCNGRASSSCVPMGPCAYHRPRHEHHARAVLRRPSVAPSNGSDHEHPAARPDESSLAATADLEGWPTAGSPRPPCRP